MGELRSDPMSKLGIFTPAEQALVRAWIGTLPFALLCMHTLDADAMETALSFMMVDSRMLPTLTCPTCHRVEFFDIGLQRLSDPR
jgi:hypothetical protein